jgi:FG-GAP repeat
MESLSTPAVFTPRERGPQPARWRGEWPRHGRAGPLAGVAAAIGCLAALGCVAAFVALSGAPARPVAAARHGLSSLPAAAQSPISAALGRDEPAYSVLSLHARNPAQQLRVAFSPRGVTVASGEARLGMALTAYGYASALKPLASIAPRASGNRVSYRRRSLTEWYVNGPLGLEQGFDVTARPTSGRGPLTFSLAISGNLSSRLGHDSVFLAGRGVALRYDGLLVTDARGHTLRSWLGLLRGHVLIRIDDRGAAYPLRIDPFIQQAELSASNGAEGDQLGYSVAVSGSTIVVGAPFHKVGTNLYQGAAYVFTPRSGKWANMTQTAELTASDGGEEDSLGYSVAISGDTIVAGAPYHEVGSNTRQGAAYAFTMPASGWENTTQTAELTASDGAGEDQLGSSVAIAENTVVAGAPHHMVGSNTSQGAAYVFTIPASGWENTTQTAELTASDGGQSDQLGSSVAISDGTIVAGAPYHDLGWNLFQGMTYLFTPAGGGWTNATQTEELSASDGTGGDRLGSSVAIFEKTIVAGAPFHVASYVSKGEARVREGTVYAFTPPAPGITISSPANGASYTLGNGTVAETVAAKYACSAPAGASVATCTGSVGNGALIDTSTLGRHTFTVTTTDSEGISESKSVTYTVVEVQLDTVVGVQLINPLKRPTLSRVGEKAKTWREGNALAHISANRQPPLGTTFSFSLNKPASVTFEFTQSRSGRKVGKTCVAQTAKNKNKHSCARTVVAGTLTFSARSGANRVSFQGLISRKKKLELGSYTLVLTATASGEHSTPRTLEFTIAS